MPTTGSSDMKQLLFILFTFCVISNSYAQMDCESIPSCAEMGYTQDSCSGGKGVRCPFDESKFYCAGVKQLPDAPEPVVTPEDWTAECADKINYCTAYNTECQCTACESGYLLSDGACVPECDKSVDICAAENKTFNSANCVCEACPTNYQFNSETKACEQIACDTTKVEHCATYDSDYEPCTCQACELNYLLVDGICKKMCTKVENCTAYDSEYDPCNCTACENGFMLDDGQCLPPCAIKCKTPYPLFAGEENTKFTLEQLGDNALAVYATSQFYVGDKNGDFGQGKWYLPSIGEWLSALGIQRMAGTIYTKIENRRIINKALGILADKGVKTDSLLINSHFSSSDASTKKSYNVADDITTQIPFNLNNLRIWTTSYGSYNDYLYEAPKDPSNSYAVRCALIARNVFNSNETAPKLGDVMYLDKTYGSAADYNGNKTPVGIIAAVSDEKKDVMIINLKNLRFVSGKINPDNPYNSSGSETVSWFKNSETPMLNIAAIPDYSTSEMKTLLKAADNCPCQFYKPTCTKSVGSCTLENKIFNAETCTCEACPNGYLPDSDVNECRETCKVKCKNAYPLFTGQEYTKAAMDHYHANALIAYAANLFYTGSKTGNFGQGKWYVPSIGEWMQFYGTDTTKIVGRYDDYSATGAHGKNKELINTALSTLANKGVEAKILEGIYWSSSPRMSTSLWGINSETGYRRSLSGTDTANLRCSSLVTAVSAGSTAPQIGDVIYEDKTYGSAADYNGSKIPVGIIASVSDNKKDVVIINLKDLTFASDSAANNFNPDNPYGNKRQNTQWLANTVDSGMFNEFHLVTGAKFSIFAQTSDNCSCQFYIDDIAGTSCKGIYQCKDMKYKCVTCYATCRDYDTSPYDQNSSDYNNASNDFIIMVGPGKGATAFSALCRY